LALNAMRMALGAKRAHPTPFLQICSFLPAFCFLPTALCYRPSTLSSQHCFLLSSVLVFTAFCQLFTAPCFLLSALSTRHLALCALH
jgi:hypothetical protein